MGYIELVQSFFPDIPVTYGIFLWGFVFLCLGFSFGYLYGLYKYIIKHWGEVRAIAEEIDEKRRRK
ncbi:MAG: hypothetical protein KAT37_01750 [Candidatus Aenigmarchaeota archaeon]|nr:hypothetical protein [Candidatus Aenigmarchaeota archaeon]